MLDFCCLIGFMSFDMKLKRVRFCDISFYVNFCFGWCDGDCFWCGYKYLCDIEGG